MRLLELLDGVLSDFLGLALDLAPILVVGFLVAAIVRVFLSAELIAGHLGKPGLGAVAKASLLGAPLPLCSCSVLPTAVAIRRAGARKGPTVSFLVSTPETGVDSFLVSFALLDPLLAVMRPLTAVFTALGAGAIEDAIETRQSGSATGEPLAQPTPKSCCSSAGGDAPPAVSPSRIRRVLDSIRFAFEDLLLDIAGYVALGTFLGAVITSFAQVENLPVLSSVWLQASLVLALGLPLYVCASASTPIAAGMLAAGFHPGPILLFLLVGPATNLSTFFAVRGMLGLGTALRYIFSVIAFSAIAALLVESIYGWLGWEPEAAHEASAHAAHTIFPPALAWASLSLLVLAWVRARWLKR